MATNSTLNSRTQHRDAVSLLKADHQQVKAWFAQFKTVSDGRRQGAIAKSICHALRVHTTVEEEIFYPAFLEATGNKNLHHEAEVEHHGAKELIAEIEQSDPSNDYFRAKVHVLGEMVKHHIKEEEKAGGMFAEARKAKMDLATLGAEIAKRKSELESKQQAA